LQILTYLSGLSGGSWPVMSLTTNYFPEIDDMFASWQVNVSRLSDSPSTPRAANLTVLFEEIVPKFETGFNVSYMDMLSRAFAYEFVVSIFVY
jgi:lysophospholipase